MSRVISLLLVVFVLLAAATAQAQQTATPAPLPTVEPTIAPAFDSSQLSAAQMEALPILTRARGDLEVLADLYFGGSDARPEGWERTLELSNPQIAVLLRLNLEILAGTIFGAEMRPPGWFGIVTSTPQAIARDLRHDLELVADHIMTVSTIRPAGWAGDDPVMRCDRTTQALVTLITRAGFALPTLDFSQPAACEQLTRAAVVYAEREIIAPGSDAAPPADAQTTGAMGSSGAYLPQRAETAFVVAFLDRNARQRVGVLPVGTGFRTLSRSSTEFSRMMLIAGEGFQVWVDSSTTSVPRETFLLLPITETDGGTSCTADWCE